MERQLPFVWEIEYQGVKSNLVGIMHHLPVMDWSHLDKILEGKKYVMVENMREPNMEELSRNEEAKKRLICERLRSDELGILAERASIPIEKIGRYSNSLIAERIGKKKFNKIIAHMEGVILARAIEAEKIDLETDEEHYEFSLQNHQQSENGVVDNLRRELTEEGFIARLFEEMFEDYLSGSVERLISSQKIDSYPLIGIKKRNINMTKRSLNYLATAPSVVAVGVYHFVGKDSMIEMYQKTGAIVKRV